MRLGVRSPWVAENLRRLGRGTAYHLGYATHQVHPAVMERLRRERTAGRSVRVFLLREDRAIPIATGEVIAVHWFPEFIRVHFAIGEVFLESPQPEDAWEEPDLLALPMRPFKPPGGSQTASAHR